MFAAAPKAWAQKEHDIEAGRNMNERHSHSRQDAGFTLVVLLVMMTVGAILLATIAPTWGYLVQRDREEELIFRGESYAFAIGRHMKEFNKLPTRLEDLTERNMIRKLYLDPITNGSFELLVYNGAQRVRESELNANQRGALRGETRGASNLGIIGVVSISTDKALRPRDGKEYYNEWEFFFEQNQEGDSQSDSERNSDNERDSITRPN